MSHWWTHGKGQSRLEYVTGEEFADIVEVAPPARDIQELILHHTWSPTADQYNVGTWQAIDNYHQQTRGWSDIGYHLGVSPGREIHLLRPVQRSGGHTRYHNAHSIGVVMVGNYDEGEDDPTSIVDRTAMVLAHLCARYDLTENDVFFHRDFANKSCPGDGIHRSDIRELVAAELRELSMPDGDEDADEPDTDVPVRYFVETLDTEPPWTEHEVANGPGDEPRGKLFLRPK